MKFRILATLFLVVCIAAIAHAQVPALSSLSSKLESEIRHSQTRLASSARSAISRISSEIQRSSSESVASSSAAQQSASSSVAAGPTSTDGGAAGGQTNTAPAASNNNNGNGETGNGGQATAAAGGSSAGMSIFSGFTNVITVQVFAWSTLFVASFVAMLM